MKEKRIFEVYPRAGSLILFISLSSVTTFASLLTRHNDTTLLQKQLPDEAPKKGYAGVIDEEGKTTLHRAAEKGHEAVVKVLIKAGAHKEAVDKEGGTPLHGAARKGNQAIVELLLNSSADKDPLDKYKKTPLHWAARHGYGAIVRLLLNAGADKNALDEDNQTPLHRAADLYHKDVVELLLRAGANTRLKNNLDRTPLIAALISHHRPKSPYATETINLLLLMDIDNETGTFSAETEGLLKIWNFDTSLFKNYLEISKQHAKKHYEPLTNLLQDCTVPAAVAAIIVEYHKCLDTKISLFKKAWSPITTSYT